MLEKGGLYRPCKTSPCKTSLMEFGFFLQNLVADKNHYVLLHKSFIITFEVLVIFRICLKYIFFILMFPSGKIVNFLSNYLINLTHPV